ncbi:universal stress protein [Couchioplanes caeruleus]|uniref:Universal stress protein n=2 Tax=Couchioplanes caeruleus TaxID=56438 RepID=A0A1K0GEI6_9ACTN|nr:universal stress protein [Couchioplanes caeruleus]OJF15634.1 universal stress protein [Couchioplanes caeruleus subsp. caeruleus]ROP33813.1 nucleotide-binding universal stress UspA family protein [Couchioplanes caeruleus]
MTASAARVIIGFDGSPAASAAVDVGAKLFPGARAWIVHLWTPPFASETLRRRLWSGTANVDEYAEAIELEGAREAERVAGVGVTLAAAAGWRAEALVERGYGGDGVQFAQLAERLDADVVVVGSRGLGGTRAVLGSVSDMVVHYARRPVLVVPHPLLAADRAALADGSIVTGWDGSPDAEATRNAARTLFGGREIEPVAVEDRGGPQPEPVDGAVTVLHHDGMLPRSGRAIAGALSAYARKRNAAVLAVGSRGRSAVEEILLGSVAMATLHQAHRPVLIVHRRGEDSAA